jgi:hypothetical protein
MVKAGNLAGIVMQASVLHNRALAKSSTLTGFQVLDAIPPAEVVAALNHHHISFVLVGAYGLAGWRNQARATEDVDIVVAAKHHKKATRELLAAFPHLDADDQEVVTRLRDKETHDVAVDLMKPIGVYRAAFKHTITIQVGDQLCRIPTLEMALATKFAPMVSLVREDEKKLIDAADFIRIVKTNPEIDMDALAQLGELVYPGGGAEIVELVRKIRAGEKLAI